MNPAVAIKMLHDAREYLYLKSYPDGGTCTSKRDWDIATCAAIGIIDDTLSRVYLEVSK